MSNESHQPDASLFHYQNGDVSITIPGSDSFIFQYAALMCIIYREESAVFVFTDQTTREVVVGNKLPQLKSEIEACLPSWHWGDAKDFPWLLPFAHHR